MGENLGPVESTRGPPGPGAAQPAHLGPLPGGRPDPRLHLAGVRDEFNGGFIGFHGIFMRISWEFHENILGIAWEEGMFLVELTYRI